MLIFISEKEAKRLLQEAGIKEGPEFVRDVNPVHLQGGTHLTYLRADQSPAKQEGYHIQTS